MDEMDLPHTNSPEVMERAICIWMTHIIWDQHQRGVHPEQIEEELLALYDRVFKSIHGTHGA